MTALPQLDGTIYINNEPDIVDITRENPGQTFIGILPGHDRPAFVRKRRRSGSCFSNLFRPRRAHSSEHIYHHYTESPRRTKIVTDRPVVIASGGSPMSSSSYLQYHHRTPERLTKHTCGSCGKFRSPTYCKAHPLAEGEEPKPSLCRKCVHKNTSSGESDRSYERYVKEQKRRRRRQLREDQDDSSERHLKAKRRRHASSDGSYERYCETRSFESRRRVYTGSREESGCWSQDEPRTIRRRVIYVDSSGSQRRAPSSSGDHSVISVSIKSERPRRLPRESRSRSSAEEVRVVRSILRESPRPRSKASPYRHRYRSESRSEGSVRFDIPPRERKRRKYRVLNYDGEPASYEDMIRSTPRSSSQSVKLVYDHPNKSPHRTRLRRIRTYYTSNDEIPRREKIYQRQPPPNHTRRSSPPPPQNFTLAPNNTRYTRTTRGPDLESMAFMSGSRGSSLSSERRTLQQEEINRRGSRRRSRSASRSSFAYSTSSGESSANYQPDHHPSYRRQQATPVRMSRLMQRLMLEDSEDPEVPHPEPYRRQIEYAYVQPRSVSRGRTPTRHYSPSRQRSPSRDSSKQPRSGEYPTRRPAEYIAKRYPRRSSSKSPIRQSTFELDDSIKSTQPPAVMDRLPHGDDTWDFGGRVRHVRASERLG